MFRHALIMGLMVPAVCSAGSTFGYGGLTLETDFNTLKQRYPNSIVRDASAWLSKTDSHDDVHYVEKRSVDGKKEIRIVFEKPEDQLDKQPMSWEEDQYARHPKCNVILQRLTQTYKQPRKQRSWVEGRLTHRVRMWASPTETMNLDCYSIDGEGESLAAELTIRTKTGRP